MALVEAKFDLEKGFEERKKIASKERNVCMCIYIVYIGRVFVEMEKKRVVSMPSH